MTEEKPERVPNKLAAASYSFLFTASSARETVTTLLLNIKLAQQVVITLIYSNVTH